ncbi:MAG TPA: TlpA disulfide reductase family protein [Conexibacter sp.]|jgi:cytochrome c biogenesis protein CcmG/thiol:disulfide interchange protein DsbE|nr:TlpA disulfide reductase family protein [Conexibacter sp.]
MRASFAAASACVLLALLLVFASGCGSQEADVSVPTPAQARAELAGSPGALAELHRQAAELLDGGLPAYRARLATLKGRPVVVNAWASWCGPCKFEMPYFSRTAVRFGRHVAFLGVNAGDSDDDARKFLHSHYVPYPSYVDPHNQIAEEAGVRAGLPTTVFYGRDGKVAYVHQGQYRDEAALVADVKRYAGTS